MDYLTNSISKCYPNTKPRKIFLGKIKHTNIPEVCTYKPSYECLAHQIQW